MKPTLKVNALYIAAAALGATCALALSAIAESKRAEAEGIDILNTPVEVTFEKEPEYPSGTYIEDPIFYADGLTVSYSDAELIAHIMMAEAEGEPEEGKRLVVDVILNRVVSDKFPNTVEEVIYQKNQFTCVSNGRLERSYYDDAAIRLVVEEICNRTNKDVVFFRGGRYGDYGRPAFKVGNHYFSTL